MISAVVTMGLTGFIAGLGLMIASKKFHVDKDPRIEGVNELLPAANCGGCGYPGCSALAVAIVEGREAPHACPVGGKELAVNIAKYLGVELAKTSRKVARVKCKGGVENSPEKYDYFGPKDCNSIVLLAGGNKLCTFGCVGEGSCVKSCAFDAMKMGKDKIPVIFPEKCTSCGMCVKACPRNLITLIPEKKPVVVTCMSKDKGGEARKCCKVACIGCSACVKKCPVGAINVENFLAKIDSDLCVDCKECVAVCPTKAISDFKS